MKPNLRHLSAIAGVFLVVAAYVITRHGASVAAQPAEEGPGNSLAEAVSRPHKTAQTEGFTKVIARHGALDTGQEGITLWHDYGAFALYKVDSSIVFRLPVATQDRFGGSAAMDEILIDAFRFNTQVETFARIPAALQITEPEGPALQLVQFVGPIKDAWLEDVENSGAIPIHYIANNAYLVWADASARRQLSRWASAGQFLQFSAPYQPFFKLGATLDAKRLADAESADELIRISIQMYEHPGSGDTEKLIAALLQEQLSPWVSVLEYQNLIGTVRTGDVTTIAAQPDIVWVGETVDRERMDEVQAQILAGHLNGAQSDPTGPGYLQWLTATIGVSTNPNDYPVVDVVDDGVGNGTVNSGDASLHVSGTVANPTRLQYVGNCTSSANGGGLDGHGHINVSIVGGYDTRSGFPFRDPTGYQRGLGINPFARLAGTRVFNDSGDWDLSSCGNTDTGLIKAVQDSGAQIASNSWGASASTYDISSQAFDVGTRDADLTEGGNQALIFILAAGNAGPGASTIGSPGNAKNVITVGASENARSSDEDGSWMDGCGVDPSGADDAMDVIGFSSRGPAPGARVKPEVIAPGTHIQGTASTHSSYTGSTVCDAYRPSGQTVFAASSGTSHSTPAVAGVSSLAFWWLDSRYGVTPSPAMMKAYLIAHPTYLTGANAGDTLPSNNQGYGMPNMTAMFDDVDKQLVDQSFTLDNTGETWTWNGSVADPSNPVRIVMAYTDKAGAVGTSPQVNNLDLEADVGGTTHLGNVFSGPWSTTGGTPDAANNYEAIFLPAGTTGAIDITVTAANIADDGVPNTGDGTDQDFALVCYNCASVPNFQLAVSPTRQDTCLGDEAVFTVDVQEINGFSDSITLSASSPGTAMFVPNGHSAPYTSTLSVSGAGAGDHTIVITGTAGVTTHVTTADLAILAPIAGAPVLVTPSHGATAVATAPTFTWTSVSSAQHYEIEIATDPGFIDIVQSEFVTGTTYAVGTELNPLSAYYWRVRAHNVCGAGGFSSVFSFTTEAIRCVVYHSTDVPKMISDTGRVTVVSDLDVSGSGEIMDVNVLDLKGTHSWIHDLDFSLRSPADTLVQIIEPSCSNEDNFDLNLDDEATAGPWPCPPVGGGTYQPSQPLSAFDGEDANGTWTLVIQDGYNLDGGSLDSWGLEICANSFGDLYVTKSAYPATAAPGDGITYRLTYGNIGWETVGGVVITDQLPASLTVEGVVSSGADITHTGTAPAYTWDVQDLAPGEGGVMTVTGRLDTPLAAGPLADLVTIATTGPESRKDNNSDGAIITISNVPPVASDSSTLTDEDTPAHGTVSASDGNGDSLAFNIAVLPLAGSASIDEGGHWTYLPANKAADYTTVFTATVTDSGGNADKARITVDVTAGNDAPFFISSPKTIATAGVMYTYAITATDVDAGDGLTLTTVILPAWLSFVERGDGGATLSGVPLSEHVGEHGVMLQVTDSHGASATQSFTLTVAKAHHALRFTSEPVMLATIDDVYGYSIVATDADAGGVLHITAQVLPAWLGLTDHGDGTASLTGVPPRSQAGAHSVALVAVDGAGESATQSFTIVVADAGTRVEAGIAVAFVVTDSVSGNVLRVDVPSGAVSESITLAYTEVSSHSHPAAEGFAFVGRVFALDAYRNGDLQPRFRFNTSVKLAITYDPRSLRGLDEDSLGLRYWDEDAGIWAAEGITIIAHDQTQRRISVTIDHLTDFALLAETEQQIIFMPMLVFSRLP